MLRGSEVYWYLNEKYHRSLRLRWWTFSKSICTYCARYQGVVWVVSLLSSTLILFDVSDKINMLVVLRLMIFDI